MKPIRLSIAANTLTWILSLFFVMAYNQSFWLRVMEAIEPKTLSDWGFIAAIGGLLVLLLQVLLSLLCWPVLLKLCSSLLLISAAISAYFMDSYGIALDPVMIQSGVETDWHEIQGLTNLHFLGYLLGLGLMPVLVLSFSKIHFSPLKQMVKKNLLNLFLALMTSLLVLYGFSAEFASFFRNHKDIRQRANPPILLYSAARYLQPAKIYANQPLQPIGLDAHFGQRVQQQTKPDLLILVVGETARAANFGLNQSEPDTTPLLAKQRIFNFSNFFACGTATAVSVPCMFSNLGRQAYQDDLAKGREGLLDVILHAGGSVLWRDNNSGCKGTCERVEYESLNSHSPDSALCQSGECWDEILLQDLDKRLKPDSKSQVIVLHQQGSHGPEYFKRYPPAMEYYQPVCKSNRLQDCSSEQVVNAYNNSIRYTDYVLNLLIDWLKAQTSQFNTMLVYVSDHGESLGENHLYLHGMPYSLAPDYQKQVPFFIWLSEPALAASSLQSECIKQLANQPFSQDNLFHTVLGLLDIETQSKDRDLDMLASCRGQSSS